MSNFKGDDCIFLNRLVQKYDQNVPDNHVLCEWRFQKSSVYCGLDFWKESL